MIRSYHLVEYLEKRDWPVNLPFKDTISLTVTVDTYLQGIPPPKKKTFPLSPGFRLEAAASNLKPGAYSCNTMEYTIPLLTSLLKWVTTSVITVGQTEYKQL